MIAETAIYVPLGSDGYELCQPVRQDDFETLNSLINGIPRASKWAPIPMRILSTEDQRNLIRSDAPWLGSHALIFKSGAAESLEAILCANGELLPLVCEVEPGLKIYNPTRLIDALDEDRSAVVRFQSGKIMMVQRYAFRPDVIGDIDIFKIPNLRVSPTFVTQRFVDCWKSSGLKGLDFNRV